MESFNTRRYPLPTQCVISVGLVLVVSVACFYASGLIGYRVVALLLLMTVSFIAMLFDIIPVLTAAVFSAIIWNYLFIPPIYTFHIDNAEDVLMFLLYFLIATVNAVLTFKIREAESKARDKEEKEATIKLYNTLLNSLSHELRTPISTIVGAVDTLKEGKLTTQHQSELLCEIDEASIRLNRQVENLLNMSRLESGMLKPKIDWCDVNELIFSVIQKVSSPSHTIQFDADETFPLFRLDAGLIEQVIYNLIHNAIQYTPARSIVNVEVSYGSNSFILRISDNGDGFPQNKISLAFDKFYRLPNARTGGSGLGLSIVKGFVEAHGGTITLKNGLPNGAIFTIDLPCEVSFITSLKNE